MQNAILVIDRFDSVRDFVCDHLAKRGYSVWGASNWSEAYSLIEQYPSVIRLIIADFNLDELTGFEFMDKVRACSGSENIQFMFMTTEENVKKFKKNKETGVFSWVKKPYQMDLIIPWIEKIL